MFKKLLCKEKKEAEKNKDQKKEADEEFDYERDLFNDYLQEVLIGIEPEEMKEEEEEEEEEEEDDDDDDDDDDEDDDDVDDDDDEFYLEDVEKLIEELKGEEEELEPNDFLIVSERRSFLIAAESVDEGHPDKLADQISDAILDEALRQDQNSRVDIETLLSPNLIVITGAIATQAQFPVEDIVRQVIRAVGCGGAETGFDLEKCRIIPDITWQSRRIEESPGHDLDEFKSVKMTSVYGYAVQETPEFMPWPVMLAHRMMMKASQLRRSGQAPWLLPGGKVQVAIRYIKGEGSGTGLWNDEELAKNIREKNQLRPVAVEKIIISLPHKKMVTESEMKKVVMAEIVEPVIPPSLNPSCPLVEICEINFSDNSSWPGQAAYIGLSGRKTMVDSYGGCCPPMLESFSGKDPWHLERSASYLARYMAKNILAAGLADRCTVHLAYKQNGAKPVMVHVNTHGTGKVKDSVFERAVSRLFPLRPDQIIRDLVLTRPIYQKASVFGHFGRELPEFTWERCDRQSALTTYFNMLYALRNTLKESD